MNINQPTQSEADSLLKIQKKPLNEVQYLSLSPGNFIVIPLRSYDHKHEFILHVRSAKIDLKKKTFQLRTAGLCILARVDLAGGLHRNPDGKEIHCPHIHVYREGYNAQWAYPLPEIFSNPDDVVQTWHDFCEYCNIVDKPHIEWNL